MQVFNGMQTALLCRYHGNKLLKSKDMHAYKQKNNNKTSTKINICCIPQSMMGIVVPKLRAELSPELKMMKKEEECNIFVMLHYQDQVSSYPGARWRIKCVCFFFSDWHLGPSKWPEHDRQPEGEDDQRLWFLIQPIPDRLHHTGKFILFSQLLLEPSHFNFSLLAISGLPFSWMYCGIGESINTMLTPLLTLSQ